jgi:EAL domain-containing protein (putative c-di-GMP-specific phosphodiesterase class I)
LKHFPFDRIKIDKSFIGDIGNDANAEAIVTAIICLGQSLGKSVTAEGLETGQQLEFLRRHACDEVQGYLLARPGPVRHGRSRTHSPLGGSTIEHRGITQS